MVFNFFLLFNCILHKTMAKYFEKKLQGEKLMLEKQRHAQSIIHIYKNGSRMMQHGKKDLL